AQLLVAVKEIRPPMAAYLGRAERAELDRDGTLTIALPRGKAFWRRKFVEGVGREVLTEAALAVAGRAPKKIEVQVAGDDRKKPAPAPPRSEVLDRARRDPLVRAIFDRFGAAVVDGQSLAGDDDGRGEDAAPPMATNDDPPGSAGGRERPPARPSSR
ncbi:MAG: hypothetical protein OEQ13_09205, partial [Acidobacteriota bacterium]|nr:hypothetical protein [Acidobacteriota bacterium]